MTEDKQQLERRRTACHGWVTRSAKALTALVTKSEVTKVELEDAVDDFDTRFAALDDAQSAVELAISETDILEEDIEAADHFRRQVRCSRVQAAEKLAELLAQTVPRAGTSSRSDSGADESVMSNIRLPRIELPKFSGNVLA